MTFNEFKNNVEQWAAERGIYEHSTAEAQLMKALSELGELADAIIKGDDEAFKDAVGDVAVCVINAAHMDSVRLDEVPALIAAIEDGAVAIMDDMPQYVVGLIAEGVGGWLTGDRDTDDTFIVPMAALAALCAHKGLDFMDCCEHAWHEIKDRKGRMVAGGAFVKDEDGMPAAGQAPTMPEGWRDQLLREHPNSDPGYWPDSLIINAQSREIEELRKDAERYRSLLEAVLREIPHRKGNRGNAPGHGHSVPGIWDEDNGALAGKECAWCKVWNEAVSAMQRTSGSE